MKKRIYSILLLGSLFVVTVTNINTSFTPKKWNLLLKNIDAIAADITEQIPEGACPNGGQYSKGDAENNKERFTVTADVNGDVSYGGASLSFGAEYSNQSVKIIVCTVDCPGTEGDCILCNAYLLKDE